MKEKKILWIIVFNLIIIGSEIFFGIISNSFALIADALHNVGDVIAIIITYIAIKVSTKKASFKYTFGFLKAEMMAAFINTLFLTLIMLYMIYEAVERFANPQEIEPVYMIIVGFIAVLANGLSAYLLNSMNIPHDHDYSHNHHHEDANIKSAYLHMLSDALISVGVVVAGIFIYFFKIYYIDSLMTILFSLYIINHSYPLLKSSFLSLLDVNTIDISQEKLDEVIKYSDEVLEYHDLHIYKPSSKSNFISFHIVLDSNLTLQMCEHITEKIKENLEKCGFNHIIIQADTEKYLNHQVLCKLHSH